MGSCGGCASAKDRCGNGLEKIYPSTAVRYGSMNHVGEFSHLPGMKFSCGGKVVIATDRGIELGQQVSLTCFGCDKSVSRDQMRSYAEVSEGDTYRLKKGRILREATDSDVSEFDHIKASNFEKLQSCRKLSERLTLNMKIVDIEQILGGERVVFYFMAEERVDFRHLVRELASEFQTRIEMRQVGARDEARLLADYETCGRECCCKNFLKNLKPISMSMAKLQKTTLDLSKVSGRCGRLKCCLRYEHESYKDLDKKLPRNGTWVNTSHGVGRIVDRQILTQLVKIYTEDGRLMTVVAEDILETNVPPPPERPPPTRPPRGDRSGRGAARGRPAPPAAPERVDPGPAGAEPSPPPDPEPGPTEPTPPAPDGVEDGLRTQESGEGQGERRPRSRRRGRRRGGPRSGRGRRSDRNDPSAGGPPSDRP